MSSVSPTTESELEDRCFDLFEAWASNDKEEIVEKQQALWTLLSVRDAHRAEETFKKGLKARPKRNGAEA